MKLKASIDYGVRTMMYLASKDAIVSSREIAERMNIPRDYLIQLGLKLRNAGLIIARPGKHGGYELGKQPSEISVGAIVRAFEELGKARRYTLADADIEAELLNRVEDANSLISSSLDVFLGKISLQDLIDASVHKGNVHKFLDSIHMFA